MRWSLLLIGFALTVPSAFGQSYSELVTQDNPLVYWRFNNDLDDTMGNVNLNPAAAPSFVTGPYENSSALSTSGGEAWAAVIGATELLGLEDFSYEMWINLSGENEGKYILQRYGGGSTDPGENSLIYRNGAIEFFTQNTSELAQPAVVTVPDQTDEWHHFVLTYNFSDATLVMYLDGQEAYRDDFALLNPFFGGNDYEIYIAGNRVDPEGQILDGFIDEVALYNYTLTADDVTEHYSSETADDYASAVQSDTPLVYWRFEEDFNDTMALYNLLPSGVTFVNGPGEGNQALFGRVTSTEAEILYTIDAFTYEFWFNPIFRSSQAYILYRSAGGAQHAVIFAYNPNALEFFFTQDSSRPLVEIANETDQWHHVAVVNDPAVPVMRIYVDGELAFEQEGIYAVAGEGNKVVVGGSDMGNNFNGYIDEMAIYDYVLTGERILEHFNAPITQTHVENWSLFQ